MLAIGPKVAVLFEILSHANEYHLSLAVKNAFGYEQGIFAKYAEETK